MTMTTYWFKKYPTDTWRKIESPKTPEELKATITPLDTSDELHWCDFGFGRRPVYKVTTQNPTEKEDANKETSETADTSGRADGVQEDKGDVPDPEEAR